MYVLTAGVVLQETTGDDSDDDIPSGNFDEAGEQ